MEGVLLSMPLGCTVGGWEGVTKHTQIDIDPRTEITATCDAEKANRPLLLCSGTYCTARVAPMYTSHHQRRNSSLSHLRLDLLKITLQLVHVRRLHWPCHAQALGRVRLRDLLLRQRLGLCTPSPTPSSCSAHQSRKQSDGRTM